MYFRRRIYFSANALGGMAAWRTAGFISRMLLSALSNKLMAPFALNITTPWLVMLKNLTNEKLLASNPVRRDFVGSKERAEI